MIKPREGRGCTDSPSPEKEKQQAELEKHKAVFFGSGKKPIEIPPGLMSQGPVRAQFVIDRKKERKRAEMRAKEVEE